MLLDSLEKLADDELRDIAARCETLLKQRDAERKEHAIAEARATLAAAGLTLRDILRKSPVKARTPSRTVNHQHPTDKSLTWNGGGKKPAWLVELEKSGGSAIAATGQDNARVPASKSA
jgi:DNA-binding protein H-NS